MATAPESIRRVQIIGVDCATQEAKTGVALGEWSLECGLKVLEARQCSDKCEETSAIEITKEWISRHHHTLLAIDAPLGWPEALGRSLKEHRAGGPLLTNPEQLFRRKTDRHVKEKVGKTPLDVGADRIARTAHRALELLQELRQDTVRDCPLAWDCGELATISAIEVYPAATVLVHLKDYEKPESADRRLKILKQLPMTLECLKDPFLCFEKADAFDAVLCLLAGADFLRGEAMPPEDRELAEKEGWIWVLDPEKAKKQ